MARIAIFGKRIPDEVQTFVERTIDSLLQEGCELVVYRGFQNRINEQWQLGWTFPEFKNAEELQACQPDFLLSIGGDGTILDATTLVERSGIPIIGLNTGRLGFLANITRDEAPLALKAILAGEYTLDERNALEVHTPTEDNVQPNFALNEIAVSRKGTTSMISVHVYLNGEFLNTYWADGLMISTPTGSTGYNLSCGGPILMPGSNNFIITPIAPHNLTVRPLVIPNADTITLKVEAREGNYLASLDSRVFTLDCETELTLKKADFHFKLVRTAYSDFSSTLRNKLLWGLDRRN